MSYSMEKLEGRPAILNTLHQDFDYYAEAESSVREGIALLEAAAEPLYYITDLSKTHFSVEEMVAGSDLAARGENPLFHHRNVRQVILIAGDEMHEMSSAGMRTNAYGNVNIKTFRSLDDAIDYIDANN